MGKATTFRPGLGSVLAGVIALAFPAAAQAHGHVRSEARHHAAPGKTKSKAKPARHEAHHEKATPGGVTTIPSVGLKVYCAGSKSPLLIRKSTQGNGTTVTVICR